MILKGKKYRIGSWAQPYIEEILRGGYVHNPCSYLEGKAKRGFEHNIPGHGGWYNSYVKSWVHALQNLNTAGYETVYILDHRNGNPIYMLKKTLNKRSFWRKRLIEERDGYRLYRLEDRNLFFRPKSNEFEPTPCNMTIGQILAKEVEDKLDGTIEE